DNETVLDTVLLGHKRLMEIGGKDQVPFMVEDNISMYESNDIVEYLKKKIA
ncbi:glutathione S-transferase N-terminal domain-containing protein, partial [bacterium]|nr:glutathione S-transferase N-terminal domain-containing protein [bacterium]